MVDLRAWHDIDKKFTASQWSEKRENEEGKEVAGQAIYRKRSVYIIVFSNIFGLTNAFSDDLEI